MKIVASITDPAQATTAILAGADIIELRLDLMGGDAVEQVRQCREAVKAPLIGTLRSAHEGGRYFGNSDEWFDKIQLIIPFVDYVDIEQRFCAHAATLKEEGKTIIASHHTLEMPSQFTLFGLERTLRLFGDIVKIVVTPQNEEDLIELILFTHAVKQPLCTGVMGNRFRFARFILPLFGSEFVYCHAGTLTAEGQYSVTEFLELMKSIKN